MILQGMAMTLPPSDQRGELLKAMLGSTSTPCEVHQNFATVCWFSLSWFLVYFAHGKNFEYIKLVIQRGISDETMKHQNGMWICSSTWTHFIQAFKDQLDQPKRENRCGFWLGTTSIDIKCSLNLRCETHLWPAFCVFRVGPFLRACGLWGSSKHKYSLWSQFETNQQTSRISADVSLILNYIWSLFLLAHVCVKRNKPWSCCLTFLIDRSGDLHLESLKQLPAWKAMNPRVYVLVFVFVLFWRLRYRLSHGHPWFKWNIYTLYILST